MSSNEMTPDIRYVERKTDGLRGIGRIARVEESKTRRTLYFDGKTLARLTGSAFKANYFDEATFEEYWVSKPRRDGNDSLFPAEITIDEDVRELYWLEVRREPAKVVGLVAGAWPRPTGGAVLGGVLSAATSMATIPLLGCGLNPPSLEDLFRSAPPDNSGNLLVVVLVLVPLAGAVAGGIGGSYNQQADIRLRDQRVEEYRVLLWNQALLNWTRKTPFVKSCKNAVIETQIEI